MSNNDERRSPEREEEEERPRQRPRPNPGIFTNQPPAGLPRPQPLPRGTSQRFSFNQPGQLEIIRHAPPLTLGQLEAMTQAQQANFFARRESDAMVEDSVRQFNRGQHPMQRQTGATRLSDLIRNREISGRPIRPRPQPEEKDKN